MSDFQKTVSKYPVLFIIGRLPGVSARAVYSWQNGTRTPEEWQQALILEKLGQPPPPDKLPAIEPGKRGRGRPRKPVE